MRGSQLPTPYSNWLGKVSNCVNICTDQVQTNIHASSEHCRAAIIENDGIKRLVVLVTDKRILVRQSAANAMVELTQDGEDFT